jgi:YVTN family beta-propeller protein
MQNHGKIQRLIVVLVLNIMVLTSLITVGNFTYAQFLHNQTLYEMTKHAPTQIAHIPVGKHPTDIGVNIVTNTIYVANHDDNTVSVIDGTTLTVIGKPIPVGRHPLAIGIDRDTDRIYVANGDETLSVINGQNNTIIRTIPFSPLELQSSPFFRGKSLTSPGWLAATVIDKDTNTKYIANYTGDNVSVFDQRTGTMIGKPIPVGKHPVGIGVNIITNTIYVANHDDGTVSVIDGAVNKVVARRDSH